MMNWAIMHQRNLLWIVFCTIAQVNCLLRLDRWWSIEHGHCCRSWYIVCFSGAEGETVKRRCSRRRSLSSRSVLMMSLLAKCACSLPHSWQDPPIKQSLKLLLLFSYSHISSKCLKLNYLNDEYVASYSVGWFQWNCSLSLSEWERKGETKLCTLDAHAYLNLFTSSRCWSIRTGERIFPMTFIAIRRRARARQRINASKWVRLHSLIVIRSNLIESIFQVSFN